MNFQEYKKNLIAKDKSSKKEYLRDTENLKLEISNLITEARIYAGVTQTQLAKLVGTKQPSIARIEQGDTLPSLSFLKKIADALDTYLIPPKFGFMEKDMEKSFIERTILNATAGAVIYSDLNLTGSNMSYSVQIPRQRYQSGTLSVITK